MGSQYIPPPEQNVVNVGDEISVNALDGIAQANPAITSTNPVATNNSVATAIAGKANLSGATFTGKIIGTATASTPAINVGTVTSTPTAPANGDIWIGTTLSFRNRDGADRSVPVLNSGNTFSATTTTIPVIQSIQGATSSQPSIEARHFGPGPAILISQRGTGDALRVEDEINETSPFVINGDGKVGIGGVVPVNANHKVAVHNGSIVFTAGYGVAFGDGTQITSTSGLVQAVQNNLFSGVSVYNSTVNLVSNYTWTNPNTNSFSGSVVYGSQTASIFWNGSTASFTQTLQGSPSYTNGVLEGPITDPDGFVYGVYGDGAGNVYAQLWP